MVRNNDGAVWLAVGKADENQVKLLSFFYIGFLITVLKRFLLITKLLQYFFKNSFCITDPIKNGSKMWFLHQRSVEFHLNVLIVL